MQRKCMVSALAAVIAVLCHSTVFGQFAFDTKALLQDYSKEIFSANAEGFLGPLVIVTNVGANDAFYNGVNIPKKNQLYVDFSVRTMLAFVTNGEKTYNAVLPLDIKDNPYTPLSSEWIRVVQLNYFKEQLQGAERAGELKTVVNTATVFGGQGTGFVMPKQYMLDHKLLDSATLSRLPDSFVLTNGISQTLVAAAVPQLTIGSLYSTEMLVRYIPPVIFDANIGKFSFFGIALKHAFSNWFYKPPFEAAIQAGYQHTSIENEVGLTKAKLLAKTNLFAVNIQASRRWKWIEPYVGISYETLKSEGSYTFTLPQSMAVQLGYDIDPQMVPVTLTDSAIKATVGVTAYIYKAYLFASTGFTKHLIFSAGLGYRFDTGKTK